MQGRQQKNFQGMGTNDERPRKKNCTTKLTSIISADQSVVG